jgi:hypothetical protein
MNPKSDELILAIVESIAHWKRMVAWARDKRNKRGRKVTGMYHLMTQAIGEYPSSRDCALCRYSGNYCSNCLLAKKHGDCFAKTNAYQDANLATSWIKFAKHGDRMISQLESL